MRRDNESELTLYLKTAAAAIEKHVKSSNDDNIVNSFEKQSTFSHSLHEKKTFMHAMH